MQKNAASLTLNSVCRLLASKSVITEQTAVPEEILKSRAEINRVDHNEYKSRFFGFW